MEANSAFASSVSDIQTVPEACNCPPGECEARDETPSRPVLAPMPPAAAGRNDISGDIETCREGTSASSSCEASPSSPEGQQIMIVAARTPEAGGHPASDSRIRDDPDCMDQALLEISLEVGAAHSIPALRSKFSRRLRGRPCRTNRALSTSPGEDNRRGKDKDDTTRLLTPRGSADDGKRWAVDVV